jgi:uncharacterized protein (TIGR02757 family)
MDLKAGLERIRAKYETPDALAMDPLSIPLRYREDSDREVAAWVAAHLAYGRVAPMLRAIAAVLEPLGPSPSGWLRRAKAGEFADLDARLAAWKWRFHTGPDLVAWLAAWQRLDAESGQGLEAHLLPAPGVTADAQLSALVQRLRRELPASPGLRFSLPDPQAGSACKRWRMFLRWMVRTGWPDLGLWRRYPASALVIPLDTHVARVSRFIGLTHRATPDGRMAQEITSALRSADPGDPLKYDFALSHLGILGDCPGVRRLPGCRSCPLVGVCRAGKNGR